ncbi:MAG: hypothetical protein IT462_05855 [Planctomycetes bacterium]|nr:hypothetical protein [Planctomycetota bacterium]
MLRQYDPTNPQDEILLLQWWSLLVETNELHTVFDARYERVSEFLLAFRQDVLLLEVDERGIWGAFWFDRSPLAGAFFSLWLRKDHRQSKASLEAISLALGVGFHDLQFRAVLVVTSEPAIAALHQRYGFARLGVVPGLYFGQPAIVSYMTDDMFDQIAGTAPAQEATG